MSDINPGDWAVIGGYGFELCQIDSATEKQVYAKVGYGRRLRRLRKIDLLVTGPDKDAVSEVLAKLVSAKGERERRTREANAWYAARCATLVADFNKDPDHAQP